MKEYFKVNNIGFGFSYKTMVFTKRGKLNINLTTPELTFTKELHNDYFDDPYWKPDFYVENGFS